MMFKQNLDQTLSHLAIIFLLGGANLTYFVVWWVGVFYHPPETTIAGFITFFALFGLLFIPTAAFCVVIARHLKKQNNKLGLVTLATPVYLGIIMLINYVRYLFQIT